MGFPIPYAGVLPKLLLTAAISMAAIRDLCKSLLESMGLHRDEPDVNDPTSMQWYFNPQTEAVFYASNAPPCVQEASPMSAFAKAVQASLPVVLYESLRLLDHAASTQRSAASHEQAQQGQQQCAICLSEFASGQEVRELPYCCHVFHKDCIDGWLHHNHKTCPLCRTSLVTEEIAMQEKLREQELSDQLASWFSSLQEEEGGYHDHHFFQMPGSAPNMVEHTSSNMQ